MNNTKIRAADFFDGNFYQIIDAVENSIYWKDKQGKYLGCNQHMLKMFQLNSLEDVVGKTDFDLMSIEDAQKIIQIDQEVLANGRFEGEESVILPCGQKKTYFTKKNQLRDSAGNVVGLVGNSINVTEQKKIEDLVEKGHQQFRAIANQVVHDIISPLSALRMIIPRLPNIPERQRVTLMQATSQIEDIANDLLRQYRTDEKKEVVHLEPEIASLFTYLELSAVLSEKRVEFSKLAVIFNHKIGKDAYFAFIQANRKDWLRMLSNLVNNAVDALEGKAGMVQLELHLEGNDVVLFVMDTGKGMSPQVRDKILDGISVTDGKENGHGIGMVQVAETLRKNEGKLSIESSPGKGTKMIIRFPRTDAPDWAATELSLNPDQMLLVLDDDQFIHGAWETHFAPVLFKHPNIKLVHFTEGKKLIEFIDTLNPAEMNNIYVLSDYELLNQQMNGLDIIENKRISKAMLVTSHYTNSDVIARTKKQGVLLLPKRLASKIPINVTSSVLAEA